MPADECDIASAIQVNTTDLPGYGDPTMDLSTQSAKAFEAERPRLRTIAARVLRSEDEADDVVQEAWLRFARADGIDDLPAWLPPVVTRLCLDRLRKRDTRAQAEGESHERDDHMVVEPEGAALLAERVDEAMRVVFETLTPSERVTFVLHDVFAFPFEEIGAALGRSSTAVRQMATRARRKTQREPQTIEEHAASAEHRRVVDAFLTAARDGELTTLLTLLAPDAVMQADLTGQQMGTEARYEGAEAVAARLNGAKGARPVTIDGELGAAWIHAGTVKVAFVFHIDDGLVREVELIADPEVLAALEVKRQRR